jgi:hypothetical protein
MNYLQKHKVKAWISGVFGVVAALAFVVLHDPGVDRSYLSAMVVEAVPDDTQYDIGLSATSLELERMQQVQITVSVDKGSEDVLGIDHYFYYNPDVFEVMIPGTDQLCTREDDCIEEIIPGEMLMEANNPTDITGEWTHLSVSKSGFPAQEMMGYEGMLTEGSNDLYLFELRVQDKVRKGESIVAVSDGTVSERTSVNLDHEATILSNPPYQSLSFIIH